MRLFNLRDSQPDVDAFSVEFAAFISIYKACKATVMPT